MSAPALVVATGGLSIPKIGATDLGQRLARQFGLKVTELRPGLVPLTFDGAAWAPYAQLAGLALPVAISTGVKKQRTTFHEDLLFTHRGLSGPAVLQISSYWQPGTPIVIDLLPGVDLAAELADAKARGARKLIAGVLAAWLPQRLADAWAAQERADLETRVDALGRAYLDQGITFSLSGTERPFPLDVVPRVISAGEWNKLEAGITQRVQALELFLDDIYGEQEILRDGVLPKRLVHSCEHFHRQAANIRPPNGVRIHVAGIDLIRDENGDFRVLEDNLRSPSGVSYVLTNRRAMGSGVPEITSSHAIRPVSCAARAGARCRRAVTVPNGCAQSTPLTSQ